MVKICRLCESSFRNKFKVFSNNNSLSEHDIISKITNNVLGQCVGLDLFPNTMHFSDNGLDDYHFGLVIKVIAHKYLSIRMHHYCKITNERLHKSKVRQQLNKTVIFWVNENWIDIK